MTPVAISGSPTQKDVPVVPDSRVRYVSGPRTGTTYSVPMPKKPKK